jgi:ATP-binding cassette subfamily F protein uup
VLDEPTNDLDLETLDLLQEVIADYDGTVLIVSHDRDFLDRTVTVTLGLDGSGKVDIVAGGYEDWARRKSSDGRVARPGDRPAEPRAKAGKADPSPVRAKGGKLSYKDQRDLDRLPGEVDRLEREITAAEARLDDADLYRRDPALFAALTAAIDQFRADKAAAEHRWLEVAEMADRLA